MKTATCGTIPANWPPEFEESYRLGNLRGETFEAVAQAINMGIDSHLEAVTCRQDGRNVYIEDAESLRCLVRRLFEDVGTDEAQSLASSIAFSLGLEWV